jgi:undecaprenyl diphosphate synthase
MAKGAVLDLQDLDREEQGLFERIDARRLPRHVAIIMDGNGRWAKSRFLPRIEGHRIGVESVRAVVETCARLGVEALTMYAFSTENWKRPNDEVTGLMGLLKLYIRKEMNELRANNVRFGVIGGFEGLPKDVQDELQRGIDGTASCDGLRFQLALNYSGRSEITEAARRIAREAKAGTLDPDAVDEAAISERLFTAHLPDPDLLIRTSGELRISNFLLWQIAYAEIWVCDVLWPDFKRKHLLEAFVAFQKRERRYGGVEAK